MYAATGVDSVIIATDGIGPLFDMWRGAANSTGRAFELYGHKGRQLQRKINVIQTKENLFHDDVACIVFEQVRQCE